MSFDYLCWFVNVCLKEDVGVFQWGFFPIQKEIKYTLQ